MVTISTGFYPSTTVDAPLKLNVVRPRCASIVDDSRQPRVRTRRTSLHIRAQSTAPLMLPRLEPDPHLDVLYSTTSGASGTRS